MTYLQVTATVEEFDEWKADFDDHHSRRAEYGGQNYQLFRATDTPNSIVVLIEFDAEESARSWTEYITEKLEAMPEPDMSEVEVTYLEMVERADL